MKIDLEKVQEIAEIVFAVVLLGFSIWMATGDEPGLAITFGVGFLTFLADIVRRVRKRRNA
ncbi:hypothetical protein [Streptomyces prunicolor]|uniref:hypothetical protein n=1 Tax=Streptomyces prunicolor TaxID=67348 RepID=UPI00340B62F5